MMQKSFEQIFNFLKFTTETQEDFPNNMLPTLDFKTSVTPGGIIEFEYFHKEMENNRVLERTTALSQGTIFSALRQNLVRRMLNTGEMVPMKTRLLIIERFIQLMVNSGHKFSFIRSVVQQAITKYMYMVRRSKLSEKDPKYHPLYRPQDFRTTERIMQKYTEGLVWYKRVDLKDEFRQGWKRNIKRKKLEG